MFKKVRQLSLSHPSLFVFGLAFLYVLLAGLFIQLIFLPFLAPSNISEGNGLLSGYDGPKFHRIAVEAASRIKELGWMAWQLKPENQIVSGIASIFYRLITPKPWILLPLNGLLHGIASLALFELLVIIISRRDLAFISTLPFIFFPSSLLWNAQLHNENYIVPGVLLYSFGWVYLADSKRAINLKKSWKAIFCLISGSLLVWLVRSYISLILVMLALISVLVLVIVNFIRWIKKSVSFKSFSQFVSIIIITWLMSSPSLFFREILGATTSEKDTPVLSLGFEVEATNPTKGVAWKKTPWIPELIDGKLHELSNTRAKFIQEWAYAGSQIDTDIVFSSAMDFLKYIPRALEIAFLAPFPQDWLASGYKKSASLMRKESAAEMIMVYFCLVGLLYSLGKYRTRIETWILVILSVGMLIMYTCAIPNVGSLYRFRYPYLMPLVCLGLSGLILVYKKIFQRNTRETN